MPALLRGKIKGNQKSCRIIIIDWEKCRFVHKELRK